MKTCWAERARAGRDDQRRTAGAAWLHDLDEVCNLYYEKKGRIPEGIDREMRRTWRGAEDGWRHARIGENPLLVSVRSGAKFSMPGMMTRFSTSAERQAVEG